jgi:hypothetical protein
MRTDTSFLRVRPETHQRIVRYIGERMMETGIRMTVNEAVDELVEYYYRSKREIREKLDSVNRD